MRSSLSRMCTSCLINGMCVLLYSVGWSGSQMNRVCSKCFSYSRTPSPQTQRHRELCRKYPCVCLMVRARGIGVKFCFSYKSLTISVRCYVQHYQVSQFDDALIDAVCVKQDFRLPEPCLFCVRTWLNPLTEPAETGTT